MIEHLSMLDNNYGWSNYQFFVIAFTKYEKNSTKQKNNAKGLFSRRIHEVWVWGGGHKTHSFLLCVFVTNLGIGSEVVGNKYNNA